MNKEKWLGQAAPSAPMAANAPSAPMAANAHSIEATLQNFMPEVIQYSLQTPVLVYFTASWCQPCKQYGPILEKLANDAKGKLRLARVDVDKSPQLAQQFRVQSVPMVFIFLQGQPIDAFAGALSESELKRTLAQVLGDSPADADVTTALEEAERLAQSGEAAEAQFLFSAVLQQEPENPVALGGLAKCLLAQGQLAEARATLDAVPAEQQNHEAVSSARTALGIAESVSFSRDETALRQVLAAAPRDWQALYDLAGLLFVGGRQEEAIASLLVIIAGEREWQEKAAHTRLFAFFEALGFTHPLSLQGRRKLSSILFS